MQINVLDILWDALGFQKPQKLSLGCDRSWNFVEQNLAGNWLVNPIFVNLK
jgi:hypothetical protein